jgi:hypothetical protein
MTAEMLLDNYLARLRLATKGIAGALVFFLAASGYEFGGGFVL